MGSIFKAKKKNLFYMSMNNLFQKNLIKNSTLVIKVFLIGALIIQKISGVLFGIFLKLLVLKIV